MRRTSRILCRTRGRQTRKRKQILQTSPGEWPYPYSTDEKTEAQWSGIVPKAHMLSQWELGQVSWTLKSILTPMYQLSLEQVAYWACLCRASEGVKRVKYWTVVKEVLEPTSPWSKTLSQPVLGRGWSTILNCKPLYSCLHSCHNGQQANSLVNKNQLTPSYSIKDFESTVFKIFHTQG